MAALDVFIKNEEAGKVAAVANDGELEKQPSRALETSRLQNLFQELSGLIDKRDSDVIKLVAEIKTVLGPSNISEVFLKLESQIDSFKFEQAKETLVQTTRELGL